MSSDSTQPRGTTTSGKPDSPPRLAVTGREAAAMIGVSLRTLRRLDAAGRMPQGYRVGSRRFWRVADVERWVAAGFPLRRSFEALAVAGK